MNFVYYTILLFNIFFSIFLLGKSLKYSPKKIKLYLMLVIIMSILRNLVLIMLCVIKKANMFFFLKYLIFLDYIMIPIMAAAITYIFMRFEKIRFIWNYFIAQAAIIIYIIIIKNAHILVKVSNIFGFIITISNEITLTLFSLTFLSLIIIGIICFIDKAYVNKKGLICVFVALIMVFIEKIITISGIKIFPYSVIGEMFLIIIMNYAINIFERTNKSSRV